MPDQNFYWESERFPDSQKELESENRLSKEVLLRRTSQKKYFFREPISRIYFCWEPIVYDSTSLKNSALK